MALPRSEFQMSLEARVADALLLLLRLDSPLNDFFEGRIDAIELEDYRVLGEVKPPSLWVVIDTSLENPEGQEVADHEIEIGVLLVTASRSRGAVVTQPMSGTVDVSGVAVTGTGTAFDDELDVGDFVIIEEEKSRVLDIASATSMTLASAHPGATGAEIVSAGHGSNKWLRSRIMDRVKRVIRAQENGLIRDPNNDDPYTNKLTETLTTFERIRSARLRGGNSYLVSPMIVSFRTLIDEITGDPLQ